MSAKDWKTIYANRQKARLKLGKAMNEEQKKLLIELDETLADVLQTVYECQDLWMSQVNKLDTLRYSIQSVLWSKDDEK